MPNEVSYKTGTNRKQMALKFILQVETFTGGMVFQYIDGHGGRSSFSVTPVTENYFNLNQMKEARCFM